MIIPYTPDLKKLWDDAVAASRNATFQHLRGYMDYHADRFADCSVLAADGRGRVVAVLPAHRQGDTVCSHRGLSFGGLLMTPRADMPAVTEIWKEILGYYRSLGFSTMYYRPAPHIYHKYPAEEDLYELFRSDARLVSSQVSSVVDLASALPFDSNARRAVRRAGLAGVECSVSGDYRTYWSMLSECLAERHGASPVHTLGEIELLHSRFPENIVLYTATLGGEICAGVVMYISDTVAHCQYIASTDAGRHCGALPLLFEKIQADAAAAGCRWFDYGTSCEDGGHYLNLGLIRQKCGFGGRAVVYNAYELTL